MKKMSFIIFLFILSLIMFIPNVKAIDYGSCIKRYGTMKLTGSGMDAYNALKTKYTGRVGNIDFSGGNSVGWSEKPVPVSFRVQANYNHTVKSIMYAIGSCTGEITGFPKGKRNVNFDVTISKGYIADLTVWGTQIKDGTKSVTSIGKQTRKIKYYNPNQDPVELEENGAGEKIGQKLKCDSIQNLLDKYWSWVIALAPVLTILLISFDLVTVIISNDADKMKKVGSNAVKRMTALVVLLFLPYILELLFGFFDLPICL